MDYERIPIAPEQAPEDRYIDEFLQKIKSRSSRCPLIFNCGMGRFDVTLFGDVIYL